MANRKNGDQLESELSSSSAEPESEFVARMRICADRVGSANALAKRAEIPQATLARYFAGSEPNRPNLVAIAEAAGVRLEWLATGQGRMEKGVQDAPPATTPLDLDLLETVVYAFRSGLAEQRLKMPPDAEARVIRLLYQLYAGKEQKPDEHTVAEVIRLAAYR